MTIAKDFASKAAVAFVALAMIFAVYAPAAQAQSAEDLQAMINNLLAQIAGLQSQVGQGGSTAGVASGVCPYTWTRNLNMGATGADVMTLQQFLNSDPDTRVSTSGAGSAGAETSYYGPATGAAVSKLQMKYRSDILSPAGLVNPTTFFGPSTRTKANSLCTAAPVVVVPPVVVPPVVGGGDDNDDSNDDSDDNGPVSLQGEASLDTFEIDDGESTIDENDEDEVIAEITVEFTDGDAEISRIDLTLVGDDADAEPWEAFETISLWVDGEKIAEENADDEDDYLDEDAGELRFTGLDLVATEDDEMEITVTATIQNNLDTEELTDWDLTATGLRFFDAEGVATTEDGTPVTDDTATFEIQEAGTDEELDISLSSSNPEDEDIIVDTDTDTNDVTVLVADLEADDGDIELNRVVVLIETTLGTTTDVIDDIRVEIDGQSFDAESIGTETDYSASANGAGTGISSGNSELAHATTAVWYLFDIDGDVVIDNGDEIAMEVIVDFNDTDDSARYPNGTTIKASVTSTETNEWDSEGAEDLSNGQYSGSAVGDVHNIVAEGIVIPGGDDFTTTFGTLGQDDTTGEFTLTFKVEAVEGDFYITEDATDVASTTLATGAGYTVDGGTATVTASLTSTAEEDTTGVFTVREGEVETFTLTVTVDPTATGLFRVEFNEIWYSSNSDGTTGATAYLPTPVSDFRTASKTINN